LVVAPCFIVFLFLRKYYLASSRDIKRIEGTARSPCYAHMDQTFDGLVVLHSCPGAVDAQQTKFEEFQDEHLRSWVAFVVTARWLGSRLDAIVVLLLIGGVFIAVAVRPDGCAAASNGTSTESCQDEADEASAKTGLQLYYTMMLASVFQWCVRLSAEVENQLTSCERVVEYAKLPKEIDEVNKHYLEDGDPHLKAFAASSRKDDGDDHGDDHGDDQGLDWTLGPSIEVKGLSLWYNSDADPVLKDLEFSIRAKEKIGVVGRTGAGKSSLFAGLLRLCPTRGDVTISGHNTKTMSLEQLRRSITVIPQDPVLFRGTLRDNLDPFGKANDEALWAALEGVQLKREITQEELGLECQVQEFGGNFSVGERQLICMARAIVGNSRILLIDEATANVDQHTDGLIQGVIRTAFRDATVLTIAHRLNTIADSDKIMVLDSGRVVEFDTPQVLIETGGIYAGLVAAQADTE
jgi:ATP-binding cassette subfamily C (CFTR/MRP) protein 4